MDKVWKIYGFSSFVFATFINAFLDLGHKILMQNTILKAYTGSTELIFSSIINALVILPFILIFSPSGFLSDKFPRDKVMKIAAISNVILICLLAVFYYLGWYWVAFFATFLLGMQAAIYSPAKFGYVKDLVGPELLAWGNGIIQACAIIAILAGMSIFSLLFEYLYPEGVTDPKIIMESIHSLSILLVLLSLLELFLTWRLPSITKTFPIKFPTKAYLGMKLLGQNIKNIQKNKIIFMSILGITMFWSISQLMLAAFPVHVKSVLGIDNTFQIQASIALSGLGIIAGSFITGHYSKNYIETGLIPLGALLISIALIFVPFLSSLTSYSMVFFIFGLGGAIFIVPLNSLIQFHSKEKELGSILAGNNFVQNIGMFGFLMLATLFGYYGLNAEWLFTISIVVSIFVAIYVVGLMPFSLVRILISTALLQRYKLNVQGFDNIPQEGGVLLLGNHISFIDWAIVQMAIPKKVHFVMEKSFYSRWYIRFFIDFFGVIPVSNAQSKSAMEAIYEKLKKGEIVCLFPEGVISRHGHLNEFKRGFEVAVKNIAQNEAVILPFYISGLWGSIFSRSNEQFRERHYTFSKRNISIAFGKSLPIHTTRDTLKKKIFEMSFKAWENQCNRMETIGRSWINSAKKGGSDIAIIDTLTGSMSYTKMLALTLMLSRFMIKNLSPSQQTFTEELKPKNPVIGIVLPASLASSLCNLAALTGNYVVANLNFTAGQKSMLAAVEMASIKQIYTSRKFLEKLKAKGVELHFEGVEMFYMEDILQTFRNKKIIAIGYILMAKFVPAFLLKTLFLSQNNTQETAAILFSSGSEGKPKGVMLSHLNIMSNIYQIADIIHATNDDCILSSLPPFHAFGLTVTTFMPLLENMLSITHSDPTDALGVAKAIAKNNVTIMCATSTLLGIYARNPKLDSIMFNSLRFVVAGAEKLKKDVAESFLLKFNKPIYEGYGATETTPVASVNLPNAFDPVYWEVHKATKFGSVGMPLPGTAVRIVDPNTLEELPVEEDGLILIGGHQIMQGYLKDKQKTDEVIAEIDGIRWYKTGDKGHLDEDGFLYITDRYSRFAKIGGEMISLGAIEEETLKIAKSIEINNVVATATAVADSKKGEMVILLIQDEGQDYAKLIEAIKSFDIPPILKPSKYFIVEKIPTLGSGKIDLKGAKDLATNLLGAE